MITRMRVLCVCTDFLIADSAMCFQRTNRAVLSDASMKVDSTIAKYSYTDFCFESDPRVEL